MTPAAGPGGGRLAALEALAAEVLSGGDIGAGTGGWTAGAADRSWVRLGGNSLQAMVLASVAGDRIGVTLEVRALLSDAPLSSVLSQALTASPADAGIPSPAADGERPPDPASASAMQRGMWIRQEVFGGSPYNVAFTCFITGPLAVPALRRALTETVQRHDGLRTVFRPGSSQVERQVLQWSSPVLDQHDYPGDDRDFEDAVRLAAAETGARPFDLGEAPALRFMLMSCGTSRHALTIAFHHILLDGWALSLVLREIFARYDAIAAGEPLALTPAVPFEQYLAWEERQRASGELDRQARFWRQHLAGVPTILDLPADRARPAFQDPDGARIPFNLGPEVSAALNARVRELGITPAAFILGAFGLTLSRYTGAAAMLIGMPVAGRPAPELEELVAVTVNLIPIRVRIDDDQTAAGFLADVQDSLARSLDNSALPFDQIVAQEHISGASDRHPLVQVAFGIHDGVIPARLDSASLDIRIEEEHCGGAQFDLELFIQRSSPSFGGDLEYATSVWSAREAEAFRTDLMTVTAELAVSVSARLGSIRVSRNVLITTKGEQ